MYTGVACCLSDGVIFAVVVVCQQKQQQQLQQQRQLQQQEWRPSGKRCVGNNYVIDMVSAQKAMCAQKNPSLCGVSILET